jgi:hypothetical protein
MIAIVERTYWDEENHKGDVILNTLKPKVFRQTEHIGIRNVDSANRQPHFVASSISEHTCPRKLASTEGPGMESHGDQSV